MKLAGGWYSAARRSVGAGGAAEEPEDPVNKAMSSAKLTAGAEAAFGCLPRRAGAASARGGAGGSGVIACTIGFFFVKYSPS